MSDKIEQFWRDADGADVMRVMDGQTVEARFRRNEADCWVASGVDGCSLNLAGWYKDAWLDHEYDVWAHCQVYDPPAWYINKPDPGEGFRLLEKFPLEELQPGDEWFEPAPFETGWKVSHNEKQANTIWYRRRIETNNPKSSDSCRSRDTIPNGFRVLGKDEERLASDAYWSLGAKDWIVIGDDRVGYANEFESSRWYAIRRMEDFVLVDGFTYTLPSGKVIRITAKGFEVGS